MPERLQKIIDMLELVEVRRTQNHKLLATAVEALRLIQSELTAEEKKGGTNA